MAQGTKITFSDEELKAIVKPDFFYTKHAAMQKVMALLGETERSLQEIVLKVPRLSEHTKTNSPKIFRGENYRQLPYMVLDHPRLFSTESIWAFRTMFWWGKEFSFTLHLQYAAWEKFRENISKRAGKLAGSGFYYCVNKSPWQYHFEEENYLPVDDLLNSNGTSEWEEKDFIKLSRKIPVAEFERVPMYASETLEMLLPLMF